MAALLPSCFPVTFSNSTDIPALSSSSRRSLSRQLISTFPGQKLQVCQRKIRRDGHTSYFLIRAQLKSNGSHDFIESGEHFLDDLSHWISKKVGEKIGPYLPDNFDMLHWIPSAYRSRIYSVERAATIFVRECLLLGITYILFVRVESFCRRLNRFHFSNTKRGQQPTEADFQASAFYAMIDPLRAGLVLWETTRLLYVSGPLLRLSFGLSMVGRVRSVGFVLVISWFLFRWKNLVLEKLIFQNNSDAPRLIAFDKVLSLVMYYLAGTCIGEVSGFPLRSVLAIGGISGIAVGLAAKEIVGNFLGGTLLFITRPFVIGDIIKAKSFGGEVEEIDFLHTRLVGFDKSPVLVPNQAILSEIIVNYSRAKCRLLVAVFQLRNEDIFLVDQITEQITEYLVNHPKVDLHNRNHSPVCYLKSMGSHGLDIELLCFLKEKETVAFFKVQQEILVKAARIISSTGASLKTEVMHMRGVQHDAEVAHV